MQSSTLENSFHLKNYYFLWEYIPLNYVAAIFVATKGQLLKTSTEGH